MKEWRRPKNQNCNLYEKNIKDRVNKMRVYGENILNSKVFDHVVTIIIKSQNLNTMTMSEL
ncbi:hypothetical protein CR513_29417, partial [Mucuna pruriens]